MVLTAIKYFVYQPVSRWIRSMVAAYLEVSLFLLNNIFYFCRRLLSISDSGVSLLVLVTAFFC